MQMANTKHETVIAHGIFVLTVIVYIFMSHQVVQARPVLDEKFSDLKHKGTVKTIMSEEDVIDCVDFYQQPAFDDPLIKGSFQMMPNSYPGGMQSNSTRPKLTQPWHKHGECPNGTIPIRRSSRHDNHKTFQFLESNNFRFGHEYAAVSSDEGEYYGAQAVISVWNPRTEEKDSSISQLWINSKTSRTALNSIEAGWIVYPKRYKDTLTRFFIYWTADNYERTGCYDLDCSCFVHTDTTFAIGGAIEHVSIIDGEPFEISISIYKILATGRWWLAIEGNPIGYWPSDKFTGLATAANKIGWGGEIVDSTLGKSAYHTTTHMGSGHFSTEGVGKSSYFRNIATMDASSRPKYPDRINPIMTNPACYNVQFDLSQTPAFFYYGGPGFSHNCR